MFKGLAVMTLVAAVLTTWAQTYKPHKGETDLKLDVEGRGAIYIRLFTKEAPKTTSHILKLAKDGFYNGLRFHDVEKDPKPYLIRFGDPASKDGSLDDTKIGSGGSGTRVPFEESGYQNVIGTVGLDHPLDDPNGGDSVFHISIGNNKFLDGHYTVFGEVVSGMDIVDKVEKGDRVSSASIVTG